MLKKKKGKRMWFHFIIEKPVTGKNKRNGERIV